MYKIACWMTLGEEEEEGMGGLEGKRGRGDGGMRVLGPSTGSGQVVGC